MKRKIGGPKLFFRIWNFEEKKTHENNVKFPMILLSTNNHRILKHHTKNTRIYTFILKKVSEFYYFAFWEKRAYFREGYE